MGGEQCWNCRFFRALISNLFKFKGGKGVATALGVILAISPWLALAAAVTWLIVFAFSRYASLASMIAALIVPVHSYYYLRPYKDFFLMLLVISVLLIWRHRSNIAKLLNGTESGFKKKK